MARWTQCLPLAAGAALAAAALAVPDPERWEPGARLALAALALGAGALVPTRATGAANGPPTGLTLGAATPSLAAAPLLALGAALDADALADAPLRAALALALIAALGAAARRPLEGARGAAALALLGAFVVLPLAVAVIGAHGSPSGGAPPAALVELARWSPLHALYHLPTLPLGPGGGRALAGAALALLVAAGAQAPGARGTAALVGLAAALWGAPEAAAHSRPARTLAASEVGQRAEVGAVWLELEGPLRAPVLHAPRARALGLPDFELQLAVDLAPGERRRLLAPVFLVAADVAEALGAPRVPELCLRDGGAAVRAAPGAADSAAGAPFPRVRPPAPGGPRPAPAAAVAAALAPLPLTLLAACAAGRRRRALALAALCLAAVGGGGAVALVRLAGGAEVRARALVLWAPKEARAAEAADPGGAARVDVYGPQAELPAGEVEVAARRLWLDLSEVAGLGGAPVVFVCGASGLSGSSGVPGAADMSGVFGAAAWRWSLRAPRGSWVALTPFDPGARLLRPEVNTWGALLDVKVRGADGVWRAHGDWPLGAGLGAARAAAPDSPAATAPPGWLAAGLPQGQPALAARLAGGAFAGPGAPAGAEVWLRVLGP